MLLKSSGEETNVRLTPPLVAYLALSILND